MQLAMARGPVEEVSSNAIASSACARFVLVRIQAQIAAATNRTALPLGSSTVLADGV
jgi:hypothetical protein